MPIGFVPLPYGLRDVKIYPITNGTAATTGIDLVNSRTFSFSEAEDFTDLRGDDGLVAVHGQGPAIDWSLESGGIALEAVKAMYGGTITETGTTPAQIKDYTKVGTDQRPYFQVKGQAISDSGGDFVVTVYRCKATGELSGELNDSNFWLTGAKGRGLPRSSDGKLYSFTQSETPTTLA